MPPADAFHMQLSLALSIFLAAFSCDDCAAPLAAPRQIRRWIAPAVANLRRTILKYSHWEFWPGWVFYPPVVGMCAWLGLRYRGFSLPTAANPSMRNGGIVGESKIEVLDALMRTSSEWVAESHLIPAGSAAERGRKLREVAAAAGIELPFVLKPNVGQRGAGFKLIAEWRQADEYLASNPTPLVMQRYVAGPQEAGIFYYRFPGESRGRVFAVTEKVFPFVVGDGRKSFEELLGEDARASLIAPTYLKRFPELRGRVIPAGEKVRLVEAGNHCQGCIFRDGSHLITEALAARIDAISISLPGFYIGRYDIRYSTDEELARGENFRIIELNGAASEATSIYDARTPLLSAYRTLYRQWELVYAIGDENRKAGHKPASLVSVWKDLLDYRKMSAAYPLAD